MTRHDLPGFLAREIPSDLFDRVLVAASLYGPEVAQHPRATPGCGVIVGTGGRYRARAMEEIDRAVTAAVEKLRVRIVEGDRAQLVAALGAHPGTSWGEAIAEVERLAAAAREAV